MSAKKNNSVLPLLIISTFIVMASCGKDDGHAARKKVTSPQVEQQEEIEQQEDQGHYIAELGPLNTEIAGHTTGKVEIKVVGDEVVIRSHVSGSPAGVKHFQNVFLSTACPDLSADKNKDNLVDFAEALSFTGPVLLPLDSDISGQLEGMEYGPIANAAGTYIYRRSTTLSRILADLRAVDPDPRDHITKLPDGQEINLSGKVVMIHGVGASELAGSIATVGNMTPEQSLPIACGKLLRQ